MYLWIRTNQTTSFTHTFSSPKALLIFLFRSNISYILKHQNPHHASRPSSNDPHLQIFLSTQPQWISLAAVLPHSSAPHVPPGGQVTASQGTAHPLSMVSRGQSQPSASPWPQVSGTASSRAQVFTVRVYRSNPIWGATWQLLNNDGNESKIPRKDVATASSETYKMAILV